MIQHATNRPRGVRLEVQHLSKSFRVGRGTFTRSRWFKAVDNVSFTVEPGRTTGVIGESGSGKTTVARMITRLTEPDSGKILLNGTDILTARSSSFG